MRDFFNWSILERIEAEPIRYLKQRNLHQLQAFLLGYEILTLTLQNDDFLKQKYQNMPSITNFVLKKFNINYIGTRHFSSVIALYCEDERELFERYFAILHEYENSYPITDEPIFIPKKTEDYGLKNQLKLIRLRPAMYFDNADLACLRAFIDGYFCCLADYQITLTQSDTGLQQFLVNIQSEYQIDFSHQQISWDRLYRYDRDGEAWGIGDNNFEIMEQFFADLEKFWQVNHL